MSDVLQEKLVPSPEAIASRVGDEIVLLNAADATYYGLDKIGVIVWELLTGGATPLDICRQIAERYAQPQGIVEKDLRRFFEDLKARKIVVCG